MTANTDIQPRDGRRQRGNRTRSAILTQAVHLASEEGLDGLTFGRVGSAANVAKSSIQALFGSREALQLATLDAAMEHYRHGVVEPALSASSPLARLDALLEGWYDFVRSRQQPGGCLLNAAGSEFRCRPGPIRERIQAYRESKRTRFRQLIAQAQQAGELRAGLDSEQLIFTWIACEAAANVAALIGDEEEFERARTVALSQLRLFAEDRPRTP